MLLKLSDNVVSALSPKMLAKLTKVVPPSFLDWKRHIAFQYVVRYAYEHSSFYRNKFNELNIDPTRVMKPSDLGNFYTTPLDVVEHAEEFICRPPQIVFESSGTTGRNKRVYFTQDELDYIGRVNAMGFFLWDINTSDRLVNAFDFCIWIPGMVTQKGIEKSGMFGMAAGKVDPIEVYKRMSTYKFNVVLGEPTWLIKLTEIAEKEGSFPLKLIVGSAEEMPYAARPWMEKVWQGAKVRMSYASVESGGIIGAELSSVCSGYHVDENSFFIEIADQNEQGYGEVVFTTLNRRTMPLIRYRNRDISRIVNEPCQCGVRHRRLERMRGRADEMVVASGGNLYPLMFVDILKDVEGITSDWQMVFKLRDIKEIMEFNLELKGSASKDSVRQNVFENIKSRYPDLWKNLSINIFETEFVYHAPGSLRADKRKLLRMIDKRYAK